MRSDTSMLTLLLVLLVLVLLADVVTFQIVFHYTIYDLQCFVALICSVLAVVLCQATTLLSISILSSSRQLELLMLCVRVRLLSFGVSHVCAILVGHMGGTAVSTRISSCPSRPVMESRGAATTPSTATSRTTR